MGYKVAMETVSATQDSKLHLNRVGYKVLSLAWQNFEYPWLHLNRVGYKALSIKKWVWVKPVTSEPCGL